MAKKFATILGFYNLYDTSPVDINKNLYEYDLKKIKSKASDEVKQNIDENTIVFIIADKPDNDILVGARKYQIKEGDRFIIAQRDVYSLFDARKIAGPTGPGAFFDFFEHPLSDKDFTDITSETLAVLNPQKGDYGISTEGKIWVYNGSTMKDTAINLKGPTGNPGKNGQNGENGQNGAGPILDLMGLTDAQYETFLTGTLVKGDYGISTDGDVWIYDGSKLEKSEVNLKGPKGEDGAQGPQGPAGDSAGGTGGTVEIKDSLPIGAITMYAGGSDPIPGWLLCNGAKYKLKSVSTINIPGHGPEPDGEELFTTAWGGEQIKWQIADKKLDDVGDLLKVIKNNYGWDTPQTVPY
jgi:hypothetical protein